MNVKHYEFGVIVSGMTSVLISSYISDALQIELANPDIKIITINIILIFTISMLCHFWYIKKSKVIN